MMPNLPTSKELACSGRIFGTKDFKRDRFSILQGQSLSCASFTSLKQLELHIDA
jgi:hypothetical protein